MFPTHFAFWSRVGILDGDHPEMADLLRQEFPMYRFFVVPAPDLRTKPSTPVKLAKGGLLDSSGKFAIPVSAGD